MTKFIIDDTRQRVIESLLDTGQHVLVSGQSGSGKTSLCNVIAKNTNRQVFIINCGSTQDARSSLIGNHSLKDGNTHFNLADFAQAIQVPNALIVLDEISRASDDAINILLPVLDFRKSIQVEEINDVLHVADGVRFMATANIGRQYVATRAIDRALLDRFIQFNLDYITGEELFGLVESTGQYTNMHYADFQALCKVYDHANEQVANGNLQSGISPRTMIPCAALLNEGFSVLEVFDNVLLSIYKLNSDMRDDVNKLREYGDTVGISRNNRASNVNF